MSEFKNRREELSQAATAYNNLSSIDKKIIDTILDMAVVLLAGVSMQDRMREAENGTNN